MKKLAFIARIWGVVEQLRELWAKLHAARFWIDDLAGKLDVAAKTRNGFTMSISAVQVPGLLTIVQSIQRILDRVPLL
jgi:hypothetical protein